MANLTRRLAWTSAILLCASGLPLALGDPSDPFSVALPGRDTQPPEGIGGDGSRPEGNVSEQHGTATFSYPIEVPPGRNGMNPRLSLDYSSSGELRGGVAVGWSMSLPTIERDPDAKGVVYRLSMGGSSQLLVEEPGDYNPTGGTRYRAALDERFSRIEKRNNGWTVTTPDGVVRTFDKGSSASDNATIWNITKEVDAFGNEIVYAWGTVTTAGYTAYQLNSIDYTSNPAAGVGAHARVELVYATTPQCSLGSFPVGAQTDNHFGKKRMRAPRRLNEIKTWVRDVQGGPLHIVRKLALGYDAAEASCSSMDRPALRFLNDITVTAYDAVGNATTEPAVKLGYGPKVRTFGSPMTLKQGGLGEHGTRKGPESDLMDIDGDGIADQVRVGMPGANQTRCQLYWRKGGIGGTFAVTENVTELPTARWDGPNHRPSERDSCTLNGQFAWRASSLTQTPNGLTCGTSAVQESYHFIDWDHDGDLDLVTGQRMTGPDSYACGDFVCPAVPVSSNNGGGGDNHGCPGGSIYTEGQSETDTNVECHCPTGQSWDSQWSQCRAACSENETYNGSVCVAGCSSFENCTGFPDGGGGGGGGGNPPPPPPSCTPLNPGDEVNASGYQWRVFRNTGGTFDPALSSATGRLEFTAQLPVPFNGGEMAPGIEGQPTLPSLVDIDGDGWLDLVKPNMSPFGSSTGIQVWRGGAIGGGFDAASTMWTKPVWTLDPRNISWINGAPNLLNETSTLRMIDMNGDGLQDLVVNSGGLQVSYNMGGSFAALKPLNRSTPAERSRLEQPVGWQQPMQLMKGWRGQELQLVDLDADGLPEQLEIVTGSSVANAASTRRVARFDGDVYLGLYDPGTEYEPLEGLVVADTALSASYATWYRANDFTDVTGDGLPDLVTFDAAGQATVRTDVGGDPMRLLTTIENGRGATTRFTYAMSTDPLVVTLAGATNTPRWVVSRVTVTPGSAQPDLTTSFRYEQPQYGLSSDTETGTPHFLGFGKVTKDASGQLGTQSSRRVDLYGYTAGHDHRGHVVESWLYAGTGGGAFQPASVTSTAWTYATLLDGKVGFSYPATSTTRTCATNATEAQCLAETRAVITTRQTYTSWNGLSGVSPLFYENDQTSVEWPRLDGQLQKLVTVRDYNERIGQSPYSTSDYRILPIFEEHRSVSPQGATTVLARTTTTRDLAGNPTETAVAISTVSTARTTRTFDATGNVLTVRRPNQTAINSAKVTTYAYDQHKIFPIQTTNEIGHKVFDRHDYGTGFLVYREGPNFRNPQVDPKCVPISTAPCPTIAAYEPEKWIIDGLGRVKEHHVAVDPASGPSAGYALAPVQWITYSDNVLPNNRHTETLRDFGGTSRLRSDDAFDGLGRLIRHSDKVSGSQPDAVTTYGYDAAGAVLTITKPDPRSDVTSVATRFMRDGLGRVTTILRPDGTEERASYAGLDVTTRDFSPVEGLGAATTRVNDARGRLEVVLESDTALGSFPAYTQYRYDAAGHMTSIVDADGNTTTMEHDLAGHRTRVLRGAREWRYGYDLDGNTTQEVTPKPAGASDAEYTSLSTFDDIGRPLTHTSATRGLTAQRRDQLYIGATWNEYDVGPNAIGHPTRVVFPGGTIDTAYDVRGMAASEKLTVNLTQGATLATSQWVDRTYNALDLPTSEKWDDGSTWRTTYDERGLVATVDWKDSLGSYRSVANYSRTVAGPPRTRSSFYDQSREWSYDARGRVVYDRVFKPSTNKTWAERTYGFDGFGRLGAISGQVNNLPADAVFEHDSRGRITRAQGPYTYSGAFSYSLAGNVTRATVSGADDVPARDVIYSYGAVDSQAVDRLSDATTGAAVAQLAYDQAGNLTARSVPGGTYTLTPDGDDQTREVAGPDGTEAYVFAGAGRRIASVGTAGVTLWFGASEAQYSGVSSRPLRYMHLEAGEPLARAQGRMTLELQYADALENLVLTLSTSGSVTSSFLYGAFGEVVASSGEANHRREFNGKEHDELSGLRFYGYRSYDPLLLRWTSADPLYRFAPDRAWDEPQRANLYSFSLNDPLRYYDPDGREPDETEEDPDETFSWSLEMTSWIEPDQNDGTGTTLLKFGGLLLLGPVIAVTAVNEFALSELESPMGIPVKEKVVEFFEDDHDRIQGWITLYTTRTVVPADDSSETAYGNPAYEDYPRPGPPPPDDRVADPKPKPVPSSPPRPKRKHHKKAAPKPPAPARSPRAPKHYDGPRDWCGPTGCHAAGVPRM